MDFRGTREELMAVLHAVPGILAGKIPVPSHIIQSFYTRIGVALLSQIQQDFLAKSRGAVGRDGIKWKPLSPQTIAARPVTAGERKALGIKNGPRGMLTPAENTRWKAIYAANLARMAAKGLADAKSRAAQMAWAILKSQGAKTKLAVLGSRQVDMGRDTGAMFRSLTPGQEDRASGAEDQVFELLPGGVRVGSNVPHFEHFHKVRPVWPLDGTVPEAWWPGIEAAIERGIIVMIEILLQSGWRPS